MAPIGKLYTYANNPRAFKALIAAKYNGVELELPAFEFSVTNKEASFLQKFPFGKVPALETADGHHISESNAISYYVASVKKDTTLLGNGVADAARVQMWINIADNEITPPAATWLYPILGFIPSNHENTEKAKEDIKKTLSVLNNVLATRTYLVGEAPTLADIHVVIALLHLYKLVLDPAFRGPYGNVTRYFLTLVNQPEFKAVIGDVTLCGKAAVYDASNVPKREAGAKKEAAPKKEAAKKEAAPKEKKEEKKPEPKKEEKKPEPKEEEEEEEDFEREEKKGPNPLDLLPPSKFSLENWKRFYSNNDEKVAIAYFWENYDPEGFSIWTCRYKYNEENKKIFMSCNLLGGFFQRLESARKYSFGSFGVFGEDDNNEIHGIWVFRGQDIPFEVTDCPDYESYEFNKVTNLDEVAKANINAFLAWSEIDGLAKFSTVNKPFKEGKNFK
jgi:elongation factor 1-gamma